MSFRELTPDIIVDKVEHLTLEALQKLGGETVRAVAFDVDGTLMNYHEHELEPSVDEYIRNLGETGVKLFIISNAHGGRIEELNTLFGEGFGMTVITPEGVYENGDFAPEELRIKPATDMVDRARELAGLDGDSQLVMVGDQMIKDVYTTRGAEDVVSVLLPRRGKSDHPGVKFLQRPAEAVLRSVMPGVPASTKNFPKTPKKVR